MKTISIILGMIAIILCLVIRVSNLNRDIAIEKQNVKALSGQIETFKINDSINGVEINGLTLQVSELKDINVSLYNDAKELNVKNRNLESLIRMYQNQLQQNKDTVYINTSDSVSNDTIFKIQKFEWKDPWTKINGKLTDGFILPGDLILEQKDTLKTASEIKYKRFWYTFWKRTPIGVKFKAYNTNPHKHIEGVEYIKLK